MANITDALAAPNQPSAIFKALERRVDETIGVKLFTLMEINYEERVVRRNYSNMPEAYPVSGEKPFHDNAWTEIVQNQHRTFVANSIDEIAAVFGDHELIQSLGCESCINIPVVIKGRVIGTLNCLHEAGHYTPDRVAASETLKEPGALAFLMSAQTGEPK